MNVSRLIASYRIGSYRFASNGGAWRVAAVGVLLLTCAVGCGKDKTPQFDSAQQRLSLPRTNRPNGPLGGHPPDEFHIEHGRFQPATDPPVVATAAVDFLQPDDEVYGVVVRGHARAYPVTMLSYYHVVNDQIRDVPIAVTY